MRSSRSSGSMPGKRTMAWSLIAVVLALFLAWPIAAFYGNKTQDPTGARPIAFHADEMWSSGKLSLVHASLENNCKACHVQPGVAVRDTACATCHNSVHDHADPRRLAAAKPQPTSAGRFQLAVMNAFNAPPGRCVECHTEHEGATAMPVTAQRFCSDCHSQLKERLTDTALLDAKDFGTDHPQFRPAVMTSAWPRPIVQRLSLDAGRSRIAASNSRTTSICRRATASPAWRRRCRWSSASERAWSAPTATSPIPAAPASSR